MFRPSSLSLLLAAVSAVTSLWATSTSSFSIPATLHLSHHPINRNVVSFTSQLYLGDEPTDSNTDPIETEIDDVNTSEVDISTEGQGDDAISAANSSSADEAEGGAEEVGVLLSKGNLSEDAGLHVDISGEEPVEVAVSSPGKLSKLKTLLGIGPKKDGEDKLSFRQKLAKAGLAVVLSYGAVSNASYGVCMSIAWYGFSKKTGLSPLAPNQWKSFLTVYSAFFVFNNLVRPIRFATAAAVAPYFERLIQSVQSKLRTSRGVSIGLCVFMVNVVGTLSLMTLGITIASTLAGVPAIPSRL